jgi:hypothetical protein
VTYTDFKLMKNLTFDVSQISKSPVPEDVETYGSIAVDVWMIDPGRKYFSISSHTKVKSIFLFSFFISTAEVEKQNFLHIFSTYNRLG